MFQTFRAAIRPLVITIFLCVASAGPVLADGDYGGTDPPKPPPGSDGLPIQIQDWDVPSLWAEFCLLFAQFVDALD